MPIDKLFSQIESFIDEAFVKMIIIADCEPRRVVLLVDSYSGRAVNQYEFFDRDTYDLLQYESEPSRKLMAIFQEVYLQTEKTLQCKGKPTKIVDVYFEICREMHSSLRSNSYYQSEEFTICQVIID